MNVKYWNWHSLAYDSCILTMIYCGVRPSLLATCPLRCHWLTGQAALLWLIILVSDKIWQYSLLSPTIKRTVTKYGNTHFYPNNKTYGNKIWQYSLLSPTIKRTVTKYGNTHFYPNNKTYGNKIWQYSLLSPTIKRTVTKHGNTHFYPNNRTYGNKTWQYSLLPQQ